MRIEDLTGLPPMQFLEASINPEVALLLSRAKSKMRAVRKLLQMTAAIPPDEGSEGNAAGPAAGRS